jgi:hypothetical protein
MKKLLLILLCVPLMFSCGDGDTDNLDRNISQNMMNDGYTGKGTWTSSVGEYVGEWKDGKEHGQGTYTWSSGTKYVGEYKDGKHHGKGTKTWGKGEWEGDKYVGQFKDNLFHGQGTYTFANGIVRKGIFENNEFIGE